MTKRLKRTLAYAFIVFGQIAAVLNGLAAAFSGRKGLWLIAALYLVIAVAMCMATVIAWHSMSRQRPYRWRDRGGS
jgi:hypothetical protein